MASKRSSNSNRKRVKPEYPSGVQEEVSKVTKLRLCIDATYVTYGESTGNKYVFAGAGSVVAVDANDAPAFLAKNQKKPCCSGTQPAKIFELVVGD